MVRDITEQQLVTGQAGCADLLCIPIPFAMWYNALSVYFSFQGKRKVSKEKPSVLPSRNAQRRINSDTEDTFMRCNDKLYSL